VTAKHLIVRGRVQGVGFRASLAWEAERNGVAGWVRNRRDGSVEALLAGDDPSLARILDWARCGPPGARVTGIEITDASGEFTGFELRPSV